MLDTHFQVPNNIRFYVKFEMLMILQIFFSGSLLICIVVYHPRPSGSWALLHYQD